MAKTIEKRGRGRPPVEKPLKKRWIRATDDQWLAWRDAVGAENFNAWARGVLDRAAKRKGRS